MNTHQEQARRKFCEKLNVFLLFHLGADAYIRIEEHSDGLRIAVQHSRVEPFQFSVLGDQLEKLMDDAGEFEHFMLNQLTPHRV